MKILVIGGTGHVGNFLVPKLLARGHEVYVGTRGKSRPRDVESLNGAKFIECNSSDEESLNGLKKEEFDVAVDFPGTAKRVWDVLSDSVSHIVPKHCLHI